MYRLILSLSSFLTLLLLSLGLSMAEGDLLRDFDLVVEPRIDKSQTIQNHLYHIQQDAIIYQFRGQSVKSEWSWETASQAVRYIGRYTVEGTFVDGVLKAIAHGEMQGYLAEFSPAIDASKPYWIAHMEGTVDGHVTADGNIQIHSSARIVHQTVLAPQPIRDQNGEVVRHEMAYTDVPTGGFEPTVKVYTVALPFEVEAPSWYQSKYFIARGQRDDQLAWVLDRLSGQMEALSRNLLKGILPLARQQWLSIKASLKELEIEMADKGTVSLSLSATPAEASLKQMRRMEELSKAYVKLHKVALTQNDQLLHSIEALKLNFMGNVMKTAAKSFISWSNVIPTDLYAGLEGYSLNTSLFALPKTLASWQQQARRDASILKDQTTTIRMMESYADYWSDVADNCVKENRRLHDRFDSMKRDELRSFSSEITTFFSSLRF